MLFIRLNLCIACLLTCGSALAQQNQAFDFPESPRQWLNSSPVSLAAMRGKGAVLYFFEEG